MKQKNAGDIIKGAVSGLVGGLVASFVMSEFQALVTKLAEAEEKEKSQKKKEEPATVKAAKEISGGVFDSCLRSFVALGLRFYNRGAEAGRTSALRMEI